MKVLSLFDGISCGMVALERAGIKVDDYIAYEIEPTAIKISEKNYPQIKHCGDVTTADFSQYNDIDILIGGSPCQSLSIIKSETRQHLKGKSKLFFEYARALKEANPKYFIFENVASMNNESRKIISDVLNCEPVLIDSADFSAQQRPRLYWTNIPIVLDYKKSDLVLKDIMQADVPEQNFYNCGLVDVDLTKSMCAMLDKPWKYTLTKRVYNPNFKCPTLTCVTGGYQEKKVYVDGRARKLTVLEYERLQTLPDGYTDMKGISKNKKYTAIGNGWTVDVIAYILSFLPKQDK